MRQHLPLPPPGKHDREPGAVPEYLDVYLSDMPNGRRCPIGNGYRSIITLQLGKRTSRVLATANLCVAWIPTEWLRRAKSMPTHGLMTFLRQRRAERNRMKLAVSEEAVADALELLAGKRVPSRDETHDTGPTEADLKVREDDDKSVASEGTPATDNATNPTPAAADAAANQENAPMQTQTNVNGNAKAPRKASAKKASPAKAATKKAPPAKAGKKVAASAKAPSARATAIGAMVITVRKNVETKFQAGKPAETVWNLVKSGMTVDELVAAAAKKGIDRGKTTSLVRRYEDLKHIDVK